jgi:hypothetical protein
VLADLKTYFDSNPNFLQFIVTAVIGVVAFVVWRFYLK